MKAQYKHQFYQKNKMGTRRSALSEERTLASSLKEKAKPASIYI